MMALGSGDQHGQQQLTALDACCYLCMPGCVCVLVLVRGVSDVVLLDDPLSALDVHTGTRVFHQLIGPTGLLQGATRLLVTHAVQFLGECSSVVVLYNGSTIFRGKYEQLLTHAAEYSQRLERTMQETAHGSVDVNPGVAALLQSLTNSAQEQAEEEDSEGGGGGKGGGKSKSSAGDSAFVDVDKGEETVAIGSAESVSSNGGGSRATCYFIACSGGAL